MGTPSEEPRSAEIPADWASCIICADIEDLQGFPPAADNAELHNLNVGLAKIRRDEVDDEAFIEAVQQFMADTKLVTVDWLNAEEDAKNEEENSPEKIAERVRKSPLFRMLQRASEIE